MNADDERLLRDLINEIEEEEDLSPLDKRMLKRPAFAATPSNILTWHLNQYTVFEDETDPVELKNGALYRRVGVKDGGRLSEQEIAKHEERLGVRLPEPWRDVYRYFNGGSNSDLFWGDRENPKEADLVPMPSLNRQYLDLGSVVPLKLLLQEHLPKLDTRSVDERLIAIAYSEGDHEAVVLDYRTASEPRVGRVLICRDDDDPVELFEEESFWWPNMRVYFGGLYIQDRLTNRR